MADIILACVSEFAMHAKFIARLDIPLLYDLEPTKMGACNSSNSFLTEHC
jgi:hypothetical protein